jgi:hypothetical protein
MAQENVTNITARKQELKAEAMAEQVKQVIYRFSGEVPLALAIGVLDIVKSELKAENNDDYE